MPVTNQVLALELEDHPEVKIKPEEVTIPKSGKVTITVP
jgi:hypothetical protein